MIDKTGGPLAMIQSAEQFADYSVEDYLANCALQITRPVEKTADERMATYAMSSSLISHNEVHSAAENACHSVRALEVVALYELISRVELSPDVRLHFAVLLIGDLCCVVFNAFGWQKWSPEADNESKREQCGPRAVSGGLAGELQL